MLAQMHLLKTGGQTIREILRRNHGTRHCDLVGKTTDLDLSWASRCYWNALSITGHELRPDELFDRHFPEARYFTILRNPASRIISQYQFFIQRGWELPSFEKFLNHFPNHMCYSISGQHHAGPAIELLEKRVGFVGLLEKYNESLVLWKRWSQLPELDIRYQRHNVGKQKGLKKELLKLPNIEDKIKEKNEEDFKLYQHVKQVIYPNQKALYGSRLEEDLQAFEQSLKDYTVNRYCFPQLLGRTKRMLVYKTFVKSPGKYRKLAA